MKKPSPLQKMFNVFVPKPNLFRMIEQDGLDGLKSFLEQEGAFNPKARNKEGCTELMKIVELCGMEGLTLFYDNNGVPNPDAKDKLALTELVYVAACTGYEGLKLFFDKGGKPRSDTPFEATAIAKRCGVEGLVLYADHGGVFDKTVDHQIKAIEKALKDEQGDAEEAAIEQDYTQEVVKKIQSQNQPRLTHVERIPPVTKKRIL